MWDGSCNCHTRSPSLSIAIWLVSQYSKQDFVSIYIPDHPCESPINKCHLCFFDVVMTQKQVYCSIRKLKSGLTQTNLIYNIHISGCSDLSPPKKRMHNELVRPWAPWAGNHGQSIQPRCQSMVVQLTKAGKRRARLHKPSPTGEKHSDMCRFFRTREM